MIPSRISDNFPIHEIRKAYMIWKNPGNLFWFEFFSLRSQIFSCAQNKLLNPLEFDFNISP